jgi:glucokinase
MPDLLLAADIGGTNTRMRLVDAGDPTAPLDEQGYGGGQPVEQAISAFLARVGDRGAIRAACFGVAGRVVDGDVRMTNRPTRKSPMSAWRRPFRFRRTGSRLSTTWSRT